VLRKITLFFLLWLSNESHVPISGQINALIVSYKVIQFRNLFRMSSASE